MTRCGQCGSALLAVLVLTGAGLSLAAHAGIRVRAAGETIAARGDALCAHFAASGAVLTQPGSDLDRTDIHPVVARLDSRTLRFRSHCIFVVEATCGKAKRRQTRDLDPTHCDARPP